VSERGSAVILMPAGLLIVIVLGSIAVDLSGLHLAQRELTSTAEAAVNDAVTFGLDQQQLRAGQGYRLDARRVRRAVDRAASAARLDDLEVDVRLIGSTTVRVTLRREVPLVFAPVLPGAHDRSSVSAQATATVQQPA